MRSEATLDSNAKLVLLPQHERLLVNSDILPEVSRARGYRSVTTKAELRSLGFGLAQCRVPALLIPIWGVSGEVVLYQIRPDSPRIRDGKPSKYETPARARMVLDVPLAARNWIGNPERPLFITEGARKADAAVSHGLCCIAQLGVWNYRGSNDDGGKVALADWESIALKHRQVYLVFDSDVMQKIPVHQALARLKAFLENRAADVHLIYLPPQVDGSKMGLDDYFAAGHSVEDLLGLASREIRRPPEEKASPSEVYSALPSGLVWHKPTRDGSVAVRLTNFDARIVGDVIEDDGSETTHRFELEARLNGKTMRFALPAGQFAAMNWPAEHLGAQAISYPGLGVKDHARCAIQALSGEVPERRVYAHVGWRAIDGVWLYLHAAGAIGGAGAVDGVEVLLPGGLTHYKLPSPPRDRALRDAIAASLRILEVGPWHIMVALFGAIWRAAMGFVDFSIHLTGPTGAGKTELAALIQQHWGPEMTARHLPGNWFSTGNALEALAYMAKDAVFVIDDFAPTGTTVDAQRLHREADRILRAQGNHTGRQRMRPDATLKPFKPPRGLILSTGEDVPRGLSLRARLLVLECSPGMVDWEKLGAAQRDARQGVYAQALAGFVRWLAGRYEYLPCTLPNEIAELRQAAYKSGQHRRTAQIVSDLGIGLRYFLAFAQEAGVITLEEASQRWERYWNALGEAATYQAIHQGVQEPARRFLELLSAALAAGRAHVATLGGNEPTPEPSPWGWRMTTVGIDDPHDEWRPQGERIGWVDGPHLFLEPDASYSVVQRLARDQGEPLTISPQTLRRRLHERGYLSSVDDGRGTLTVRRTIDGIQRSVLHLDPHTLTLSPAEHADKSDITALGPTFQAQVDVGFGGFPAEKRASHTQGSNVLSAPPGPPPGISVNPQRPQRSAATRHPSGTALCHACGGTRFWQSIYGSHVCAVCHPPAAPTLVATWLDSTEYSIGQNSGCCPETLPRPYETESGADDPGKGGEEAPSRAS